MQAPRRGSSSRCSHRDRPAATGWRRRCRSSAIRRWPPLSCRASRRPSSVRERAAAAVLESRLGGGSRARVTSRATCAASPTTRPTTSSSGAPTRARHRPRASTASGSSPGSRSGGDKPSTRLTRRRRGAGAALRAASARDRRHARARGAAARRSGGGASAGDHPVLASAAAAVVGLVWPSLVAATPGTSASSCSPATRPIASSALLAAVRFRSLRSGCSPSPRSS